MTVSEAVEFFRDHPEVTRALRPLADVGLDYLRLGQPVPTLSGGEAQRLKLAGYLAQAAGRRGNPSTAARQASLFLFDEPTTGLHFHDVAKLLDVLHELVATGNSVVVIEHNLEVIKTADWILDLGPEGGDGGGEIVVAGTPETVVKEKRSYAGQFLKPVLARGGPKKKRIEAAE